MKRKSSDKKTGLSAYHLILLICTLNLLPLLFLPLSAANKKLPPLEPTRTETPPVIDGLLDDPVWSRASSESGFLTWRPDFGRSGIRLAATSQFTREFQLSARYNYGQKIRYVQAPYHGRGTDALCSLTYLPSEKIHFVLTLTYSDFFRSADGVKEYDYTIIRSENVYQFNKYLFLRAIAEYNSFWRKLTTGFLVSFTYIPGTVVHAGYGSLYEKIEWREETGVYEPSDRFLETRRSFFFKVSYLWRL